MKNNMLKFLVWDFDGTLCDSSRIAFEAHNKICKKYNLPEILNKYDYAKLFDDTYDNSLLKYLDKTGIESYFKKHRDLVYKQKNKIRLFTKVIDEIEKNKIPSMILTSTYEKTVKYIINNNGYYNQIFCKIIGRETPGNKLDKMKQLLKELSINNDEVVYIGDTMSDVRFCQKAHINIITVSYGYSPYELLKSNIICKTQEELITYIKKLIINNRRYKK